MKFLEKIKLLFKIRKPAGEIVKQLKGVKRGWKTLAFWITLLGSGLSTVGALTGIIPPIAQLAATTALTVVYNILRGAKKQEEAGVRGPFRTTELLVTSLNEIQKGIVAAQAGGINPEWFTMAHAISSMIAAAAAAAGQSMAAQQPKPGDVTANTSAS